MQRLYVTGASGFVGGYLRAAVERGAQWQWHAMPHALDLRDAAAVAGDVANVQPDAVVHLAAQSFVPASFDDPRTTFEINVLGTLNLLQALQKNGFRGRLLYVSSGDVYGSVDAAVLPLTEAAAVAPRNPYAASKVAAEVLCQQWQRAEGLDVVIARPFNHIGAGQDPRFAVSAFAQQIAEIARGRREPIVDAGDLDITRDFTAVDDVVAAYLALLERGVAGEVYNVASGRETRLSDVLALLAQHAGVAPAVRTDPQRLRAGEQRRMCADAHKLTAATGWSPQVPLQDALARLLDDWMERQQA